MEPMPPIDQTALVFIVALYMVAGWSLVYFAPADVVAEWAHDLYGWMKWFLIG